jgi:hypothetical protein
MRHIEDEVTRIGAQLRQKALPFAELEPNIEALLKRVLPEDDSGIRFSTSGYGVTADLEITLTELYERYVGRYAGQQEVPSRSDEEIWRVFRAALEKRSLLHQLGSKRIVAPDYEYEFKAGWKNGVWHVYEPVSFDLVDPSSIIDKANRWLGRVTNLSESSEQFQLHMLLGMPEDPRLQVAAEKATKILKKMSANPELVLEAKADSFAQDLEREMELWGLSTNQPLPIELG